MDENRNFIKLLSTVMDEDLDRNDSEIMQAINDIKLIVDEQLIPAIEEIQYGDKYRIIDHIKEICQNISLYMYFPELIGKNVIGFYHPGKVIRKSLYLRYLNTSFSSDGEIQDVFWEGIPAVITNDEKRDLISLLNVANKSVDISYADYIEILKNVRDRDINICQLANVVSIPVRTSMPDQIVAVIPDRCSENNRYYRAFCDTFDVLILQGKDARVETLEQFSNISAVFIQGNIADKRKQTVRQYCVENRIALVCNESMLFDIFEEPEYKRKRNNFCYKYIVENLLYEISWYLAKRKRYVERLVAAVNDNLLYKDADPAAGKAIKKIQMQYADDIREISEIYYGYKSITDILIDKIDELQKRFQIQEGAGHQNDHIGRHEIYVELLIKIADILKEFPENNTKGIVRQYKALCADEDQTISDVVFDSFLDEDIPLARIDRMLREKYGSDHIKRIQADMGFDHGAEIRILAGIILKIRASLTGRENYILGKWYLEIGNKEESSKYLDLAFRQGEEAAGDLIVSLFGPNDDYLKELADYGVPSAAYKLGRKLYRQSGSGNECMKYLHIAAAKKNMGAIKLLGDIEYDRSDGLKDDPAKKALHYYLVAEKNGSKDTGMFEKIAKIYYAEKDYNDTVKYCTKANTAETYYYLGLIKQNGLGCAVNESKALNYYESAIEKGHMEAQVAYERLIAKIAEEKKKNTVEEDKSYSSYSYYSGYYSSGW